MSGISTHILDISRGRPAAGVRVALERKDASGWPEIANQVTDEDGRVKQMIPAGDDLRVGQYRLTFGTGAYFDTLGIKGLYPVVQITFAVTDTSGHYHIPLLLTANGYSTYRGS